MCARWFHSHLIDRAQIIVADDKESKPIPVSCSVSKGSVLGPVQFISYSEDVVVIFSAHHVQYHIFADDKQLFASVPVPEVHEVKKTAERCVAAITDWCVPSTAVEPRRSYILCWREHSRRKLLPTLATATTIQYEMQF